MKANFSLISIVARAMVALLAIHQAHAAQEIQGQRLTTIRECIKTTADIMRDGQANVEQGSQNIPVLSNKQSLE